MEVQAVFKDVHNHFNSNAECIILSNEDTLHLTNHVFVIISDIKTETELYTLQINCEFFCSIFRAIKIWNDFVVIGFDNYCYLFNYNTKEIVHHKLNSYFDNFFVTADNIFICSGSNINCFDTHGKFLWRSEKLGIQSVKISKIEGDMIIGSGDWDEPEGWKNFEFSLTDSLKCTKASSGKTKGFFKNFKKRTFDALGSF